MPASCICIRPYRSTIALMSPFCRQMRRAKWGSSNGFASSQCYAHNLHNHSLTCGGWENQIQTAFPPFLCPTTFAKHYLSCCLNSGACIANPSPELPRNAAKRPQHPLGLICDMYGLYDMNDTKKLDMHNFHRMQHPNSSQAVPVSPPAFWVQSVASSTTMAFKMAVPLAQPGASGELAARCCSSLVIRWVSYVRPSVESTLMIVSLTHCPCFVGSALVLRSAGSYTSCGYTLVLCCFTVWQRLTVVFGSVWQCLLWACGGVCTYGNWQQNSGLVAHPHVPHR